MRLVKKRGLGILFAIIVVSACSRAPGEHGGAVVKVGLPTPLTGGAASYGSFIRQGAELAIADLGQKIVAAGPKIQLVVEDGRGDPEETSKAARKLISRDHVSVLMDAFLSNATLAEVPIANEERIPLVVSLSTADKITSPGTPFVFRVCSPNTRLAHYLGEWVVKDGSIKRVAYVFESTEFGTNLASTVRDVLTKAGVETVAFEAVAQHETNLLPVVDKLKAARPDAVFIGLIADSALPLLQQAKEAGFGTRWLNAASVSNPIFLSSAGNLATGFVGVTHYVPARARGRSRDFEEAFKARYGTEPTHYSAVAFDAINVIAEAVRLGGPTPEGIQQGLRRVSLDGVTGHIRFDESGQASIDLVAFQWNGSTMVPFDATPPQ